MRGLFFLGLLAVGGLFVAGAIHIQKGPNNDIEITVDKQRAEQAAERALEEGREVLQQAEQQIPQGGPTAQQPDRYNNYNYNR